MTKEPQVEQGMQSQESFSRDQISQEPGEGYSENLSAAIDAIAEQMETYKDAGMTQISGWLE